MSLGVSETRLDAAMRLLSDRDRRRIIRRLRDESTGETTFEALLDDLHDPDAAPPTATRPDREQLSIRLTHSQLPRLADYGIIDHDRDADVIRYRPDQSVEKVLDALPTEEPRASSEF